MVRRPVSTGLLLACALAGAATTPAPEASVRTVWRDDCTIRVHQDRMLVQSTVDAKPREFSLPPGTLWASWRPEGIYALLFREEESKENAAPTAPPPEGPSTRERLQVVVNRGKGWELLATLPPWLNQIRAAIPTKDGRLFLVPGQGFLSTEDLSAWFPFAILGPDAQGRWTQLDPVYLEWGKPFLQSRNPKGELQWSRMNPRYAFIAGARIETPEIQDRIFELDSGWAFLDRHHGLIWVFGEDGKLLRRIALYDELKDEDLDRPFMSFPTGVLACETAPGGRLWLAGRNDTAFFFSRVARPILGPDGKPSDRSDYLIQQTISSRDFPDLQWWEVDTDTGQAWHRPAPAGAPAHYQFNPDDPNWHFHFRVGSDGNPRFTVK